MRCDEGLKGGFHAIVKERKGSVGQDVQSLAKADGQVGAAGANDS